MDEQLVIILFLFFNKLVPLLSFLFSYFRIQRKTEAIKVLLDLHGTIEDLLYPVGFAVHSKPHLVSP